VIEHGIGESRAARIQGDDIVEARIFLEGIAPAGTRLPTKLKTVGCPAVAEAGAQEYLLPKGAPGVTQGATLTIEVTREAIPGAEPWKRPLAVVASEPPSLQPDFDARTLPFPAPRDELGEAGWWDLIEEARSSIVHFPGGELRVSPTPAMTLIDVDGQLPPLELARAGAEAAARAIVRHGIGGSIGIDLPTVGGKAERQAVAVAIDSILPQPFERTAVNGFGFLQIVRPRRHASLFELAQDRAAFEARALLRRAAFEAPGTRRLVAHPAMIAVLESRPEWIDALARQTGGAISLRADAALPMSGGYAEKL
jgi:hypothetical protein